MRAMYAHSSMYGTFSTECTILKEKDDRYYISFYDIVSQEHTERWVDRENLEFPAFSELVI